MIRTSHHVVKLFVKAKEKVYGKVWTRRVCLGVVHWRALLSRVHGHRTMRGGLLSHVPIRLHRSWRRVGGDKVRRGGCWCMDGARLMLLVVDCLPLSHHLLGHCFLLDKLPAHDTRSMTVY
jgi:hypothetical protein